MAVWKERLTNPDPRYRPLPFWSWNDQLEDGMMTWQIQEMAKSGAGGYFMHARSGIEIEYLGEEWFARIATGIREGVKNGMLPWAYDEEGWPSGFAGGKVPALGEEYYARGLAMTTLKGEKIASFTGGDISYPDGTTRTVQLDRTAPDAILGIYQIDAQRQIHRMQVEQIDPQQEYAIVFQTSCPYYIDIINAKVVKAFLDSTHEAYYQRFKDQFGTGLGGFFTDEPRISEGDVPWSFIAREEFEKRYHYDVVDFLPALFVECAESGSVRYDFWTMISELFSQNYMKQIYDWCESHGCKLTGHVMMEESIYSQMTGTSGSMPFYEYMHIPGIDWLRRTQGSPVVPKQVASVAEQLGKKQVITETYALCGWNISFEELRWMAQWQYVCGINLMCQHLSGYTIRGMRKRDYPPSLFIQQPWWKEYRRFNDYLARLGVLLTDGKKLIDTLVIHPMRSGYLLFDGTNNSQLKALDHAFESLAKHMSGLHVDYHFGDETMIKRHGAVRDGRLWIGQYGYTTVVLPQMVTIDENTLRLLVEFAAQGGHIIAAGALPTTVGGRKADAALEQLRQAVVIPKDSTDFDLKVSQWSRYAVDVRREGALAEQIHLCQRTLSDGKRMCWLVNTSHDEGLSMVRVSIPGHWRPVMLDVSTLEETTPDAFLDSESTCLQLDFAPMQSYMLILEEGEPQVHQQTQQPIVLPLVPKQWEIVRMDPGCLTLDLCEYRVDEGPWMPQKAVIRLFKELLAQQRDCDISLRFHFQVSRVEDIGELELVLETPEKFSIVVNDQPVPYTDHGWWKDTSMKRLPIREHLREGDNTIVLSCRFHQRQKVYDVLYGKGVYETEKNKLTYDTELESIYLIGNFGVISESAFEKGPRAALTTDGGFVLVKQPTVFAPGSFTQQGLCFFAGCVTVQCPFVVTKQQLESGKPILLSLPKPMAAMIQVSVNQKPVKALLWAPYEVDVTAFVREGENILSVELFSGNRNLLGPHHHVDGEVYNVGPSSFEGVFGWVERPTEAVAIEPWMRTKNYWSDRYCFVEFGI